MPFKPGQSGNPRGRPRHVNADGKTVAELARDHTGTALSALVRVIEDQGSPPSAVVSAATALLDRGWGRPKQEVGPVGGMVLQVITGVPERGGG